jgi:hypothetical protein
LKNTFLLGWLIQEFKANKALKSAIKKEKWLADWGGGVCQKVSKDCVLSEWH